MHAYQAVDILVDDCMAAMQFFLERNKDYHRANYQIARALRARGRHAEAAAQLRALFSTTKRPFWINMWEITDPTDAKACPPLVLHSSPTKIQRTLSQCESRTQKCFPC